MKFDGNTWYTYLIYSVIAAVAFLGNSLVLYVLVTRSYYLRQSCKIFICSLAITDIITSIILVFSRYLYLPSMPGGEIFQEIYCRTIWSAWILFTLGYISIYTCLALTIERWFAVIKPMAHSFFKPIQTRKAIALVWVVGIAVNVSTLFRVKFNKVKQECSWKPLNVGNEELPWLDFTLQSLIPFSTIAILYSHILYTLRGHPFVHEIPGHPLRLITKMTLAASCALIIGWLPSRVSFMLSKFGYVDSSGVLHFCLVMVSFSNSCVNPFIYSLYSKQFRKECREVLSNLFLTCKRQQCPEPHQNNAVVINNINLKQVQVQ